MSAVGTAGKAFRAQRRGTCARCGGAIEVGQGIARAAEPAVGFVHVPRCPQ